MEKRIPTTCTLDCPDACSILVTVRDGNIVSRRTNPINPYTQSFLCIKGNNYLKRFYSPDRLLKPMIRKSCEKKWLRPKKEVSSSLNRVESSTRCSCPRNRKRHGLIRRRWPPAIGKTIKVASNRLREAIATDMGPTVAFNETRVFIHKR